MNPHVKSNLILSSISASVIVGVFYLWNKNDKNPPVVRNLVKLFLVCVAINFGVLYTVQNNMIPKSLKGGGASSAPWSAQEAPLEVNRSISKLTEIDLNEPTF